ncbi:hypothetical protein [Streptomyces sp. NPDC059513]|uniref:hypothetical protein n=1 Tax=unclassified Streptomyces TaxID=2593676 RepID=UPI0036AF4F8E
MTQAPRVNGAEHDLSAAGPQPGRSYRELTGGPLIDVTGSTDEKITTGAYLITPHGPGGRASYAPTISRPNGPWVWESDVP